LQFCGKSKEKRVKIIAIPVPGRKGLALDPYALMLQNHYKIIYIADGKSWRQKLEPNFEISDNL